jgi:tetratricopeptide (TPR) repeat protein
MKPGRTTFAPLPAVVLAALVTLAWTAAGARADALSDGKRALKDGNAEQAIPLLRQAVKEDANRPEAQIALGQALERRRRYDEAVTAYQAAIKLDPRSSEAQRGLGVSLVHLGKVDEGAKALQAAIDLDRKFPDAALALGDALVQLKRYDDAVTVLTEGTKWGPKLAPYFYEGLGRAEAARGKVKEAEV